MRYDKAVYFQKIKPGAYNPATGDHDNSTVDETKRMASVKATSLNTMHLVYGEIRQNSKTIHLQNHYDNPFDRIRIGNKLYAVDRRIRLRTKEGYVISEVQ